MSKVSIFGSKCSCLLPHKARKDPPNKFNYTVNLTAKEPSILVVASWAAKIFIGSVAKWNTENNLCLANIYNLLNAISFYSANE